MAWPSVAQLPRPVRSVTVEAQLGWANGWQAWRAWRAAAEAAGVLVFQFAKVTLEEARGLSLLEWPLPVVGINSKEAVPEAKVFTLLHELVHLMLACGRAAPKSGRKWSALRKALRVMPCFRKPRCSMPWARCRVRI